MGILRKLIIWISSLKVAILLLFLIAIASALGTAIPQGEPDEIYLQSYEDNPWLGIINGKTILLFNLDQVYSSNWFLFLITWLGISLIVCSWRRQLPTLKSALKWIDYKDPRQLKKLSIAESIEISNTKISLEQLSNNLHKKGWQVKQSPGRIAARKGVIGRLGPPLVHIGIIILLIGAVWGVLRGQRIEQFLAPGRSFNLINTEGDSQLKVTLKSFNIDRDPAGRTEQFRSKIKLEEPGEEVFREKEISVNNPFRYRGMTIYQADWSLAAITLQLGESSPLKLPLRSFPELGDQIWGIVLPTQEDGDNPILISLSSEKGPVQIFDENGDKLSSLRPGGESKDILGINIRVIDILPTSGILLKYDPGVPLVYTGFGITLIGTALSIVATNQLWAIITPKNSCLYIAGLSNRNLSGLSSQIQILLSEIK